MLKQKIAQGLHHLGFLTVSGQAGGQAVEAQDIEQHPQKTRAKQVAALRKNAAERSAAPLQGRAETGLGHLHRKRHI